jgi:hypothetical protein
MKNHFKIVGLVTALLVISGFLAGCASTPIIQPDPANPFTGTWIATSGRNYMHIIEGHEGSWYTRSLFGWKKYAVYTIEQNDSEYTTSNHWRISVNGDILTVENMTYERLTE